MNTMIIGYDNGRLYTKAVTAEGKKVIILNAVSKGYELRQLETGQDLAENQIDFVLYEDDEELGHFFIGTMAVKNHRGDLIISTSGLKKFDQDQLIYEKAKYFGILGLLAYKSECVSGSNQDIFAGTGLPIEEYFDDKESNLAAFQESILGKRYRVEFMAKLYNAYSVNLRVKQLEKTAEGTSSLLGSRLKISNGKLVNDEKLDKYLKDGPILVLNIGSSTSDAAALCEDGTYDSKAFIGLEIGSEFALDYISKILKQTHQYMPDKIFLESLVLSGKNLRYKGANIELKKVTFDAYYMLMDKLRTLLHEALRRAGIDVSGFGAVYYTGGTCEFIVKNYGEERVLGLIKNVPGILSEDPIYDDAKGYMIQAFAAHYESKLIENGLVELSEEDVIEVS